MGDQAEKTSRSTEEVFRSHLELRSAGDVERDIQRNYAPDVVICSSYGVFHGHDGVRQCARRLKEHIGDAHVTYRTCLVHDEIAFLEWIAQSQTVLVEDGVDTFLIRNGRIVRKTVHYTPRSISRTRERSDVVEAIPGLHNIAAKDAW